MEAFYTRNVLTWIFLLSFCRVSAQMDSAAKGLIQKKNERFVQAAADSTLAGTGIKRMLIGKNYRKEWTQPVKMPVFDFDANGGMEIKKAGGGKETKALHLESGDGKEWALRSVEKFPDNAIPPQLRNTASGRLVKDGVSASYPYGALSMETLSNAANVPYFKEKLVYLPDDPALGEHRLGKNLVMWLEDEHAIGISNDYSQPNSADDKKKNFNTKEVVYELQQNGDIKVAQLSVLRARLLDNFVMDFDRHEEQWDWIRMRAGNASTFYAVPKDRDQVFYKGDGMLMKILSSKSLLPQLQGFRAKTKSASTFNTPAQNFDRYFLNELTEADWSNEIDQFLREMTDSVIDNALHKQPAETQEYSSENIIQALKQKRKYFKDDMMKYYGFLSHIVTIVGSNKADQFTIVKNAEGSVTVQRGELDSSQNLSRIVYKRKFNPGVTKEIRIYGLEGDDKFFVKGKNSKIAIRLIGGPGHDVFINDGDAHNVHVYDVSYEQNTFSGSDNFKKRVTNDPLNNIYNRLDHRYNSVSPSLAIEFSLDGGLFLGPKLKIVRQGFRKDPYASRQVFFVTGRIGSSAYHIKYNGDFTKLFGNTDLIVQGDIQLPTTRTLFFGLGNNTEFHEAQPGGHKDYLVQYNMANVSVSAQNSVNSWLRFRYGPVFQYFSVDASKNQNSPAFTIYHLDNKAIDSPRFYAGVGVSMQINTKNDELIPSRGVDFSIYGKSFAGLTGNSEPVIETGGHLTLYTDFISKKHVILSTSFGAGKIFGNYSFEQAQYLGFKQNLRGFRFDRFAGRSRAYNNTEVRWSFGNDINLGLFRGSLGLLAFNDVGRVWIENEKSKRWHDGYGAGLWIAPLNRLVIAGSLSYSKEEKNFAFVTIGFQF